MLKIKKVKTIKTELKNTDMIRKLNVLGHIVIAIEIRNQFNLIEKNPIEIYVEGTCIILKKFQPNRILCGNTEKLEEFKSKLICSKCKNKLKEKLTTL